MPSKWLKEQVLKRQRRANEVLQRREEFWGKRFETISDGAWAEETRDDARLWNEISELLNDTKAR